LKSLFLVSWVPAFHNGLAGQVVTLITPLLLRPTVNFVVVRHPAGESITPP